MYVYVHIQVHKYIYSHKPQGSLQAKAAAKPAAAKPAAAKPAAAPAAARGLVGLRRGPPTQPQIFHKFRNS